jgi:subtilase family serine protease
MFSEGLAKSAKFLLALATVATIAPLAQSQQFLPLPLPRMESGESPIAYMRPHYVIHEAAGASLATPPTSAFAPNDIRHAYGFDLVSNEGAGQTIAIVDAYDDANIEADLGIFSKQYNLPSCTTANGCFLKVYASGSKPSANSSWSVEIALDVEWAHAIAPQAKIVLVEAKSYALSDLLTGVDVAVRHGASAVSMSWTTAEFSSERNFDNHFVATGVTFLAASGDAGYGVNYPAASPDVIAVGGTSLTLDANKNYQSETAWSGSGGGISAYEHEALYQEDLPIPDDSRGSRGVPDVSFNANPGTGYAIYDSIAVSGATGWFQVGGTSAGTPQWAAAIAIANSLRTAARKANLGSVNVALYASATAPASSTSTFDLSVHGNPASLVNRATAAGAGYFFPVTSGTNGNCGNVCDALSGYDFVTGLGTPRASALVPALATRP